MNPKISVIVPVYNAEPCLVRCIDSILTQTFRDFELLLIDDGSKDRSGAICDRYAARDSRVKVFHKVNGGVSSARNVGLDHAGGEWITFCDSDDYVRDAYLENLLSHTDEHTDMVISYAEVYGRHGFVRKERYPAKRVDESNFETIFVENDMHWHTSPWSKLYRRAFIEKNGIRFCEGMHIGEDALFLYTVLLSSKGTYISGDADYCYFACTENSLTKRVNSLDAELLSYGNIKQLVEGMIESRSIQKTQAVRNLCWMIASYQRRVLNALYHNKVAKARRLDILEDIDWTYYVDYNGCDSIKERWLMRLLRCRAYRVYDWVRSLSVRIKYGQYGTA